MIITDEQDPSRKRPVAPEAPVSPSTEGGHTAPTITSVSSASMSTSTHAPGPSRHHPIPDEEVGHSDVRSPPSYEETTRLWRRQDAKGKTLWRFIQTLLVAVLVYVVLGGLAGIIWDTAHKRGAGSVRIIFLVQNTSTDLCVDDASSTTALKFGPIASLEPSKWT
jgi:hypothetical protein